MAACTCGLANCPTCSAPPRTPDALPAGFTLEDAACPAGAAAIAAVRAREQRTADAKPWNETCICSCGACAGTSAQHCGGLSCGMPKAAQPAAEAPVPCGAEVFGIPGCHNICDLPAGHEGDHRDHRDGVQTAWPQRPETASATSKKHLTDENLDELEDYARGGDVAYGPCALILDALDEIRERCRASPQPLAPDIMALQRALGDEIRKNDALRAEKDQRHQAALDALRAAPVSSNASASTDDAAKGIDDHALAGVLVYLANAIDRGVSPVVDEDLSRNVREARNRARWLRERAERGAPSSSICDRDHFAMLPTSDPCTCGFRPLTWAEQRATERDYHTSPVFRAGYRACLLETTQRAGSMTHPAEAKRKELFDRIDHACSLLAGGEVEKAHTLLLTTFDVDGCSAAPCAPAARDDLGTCKADDACELPNQHAEPCDPATRKASVSQRCRCEGHEWPHDRGAVSRCVHATPSSSPTHGDDGDRVVGVLRSGDSLAVHIGMVALVRDVRREAIESCAMLCEAEGRARLGAMDSVANVMAGVAARIRGEVR